MRKLLFSGLLLVSSLGCMANTFTIINNTKCDFMVVNELATGGVLVPANSPPVVLSSTSENATIAKVWWVGNPINVDVYFQGGVFLCQ